MNLENHSVCPLVRIGIPPPPLPHASVSSTGTKRGGDTCLPDNNRNNCSQLRSPTVNRHMDRIKDPDCPASGLYSPA